MIHRHLVIILCLVLLAGCNGLAGPDSTTTAETLTPVPVSENATAAPGIPATNTGSTTVYAGRLLAADSEQRSGVSYRLVRSVTIRGTNWTTRIDRDRRVAPDGRFFERVGIEGDGPLSPAFGQSELWSNGSTTYVRTFDVNGNRIEQGRFPSAPAHFQQWPMLRNQALQDGTYRVESTADGAVLRSTGRSTIPTTAVPLAVSEPRNVTLQVVVMETGLIRSVQVRYETTIGGEQVRVEIQHRTHSVGSTSVDFPEWAV